MTNTPKYNGLELPIHDPATPVAFTKSQLEDFGRLGTPSFVRRVDLRVHAPEIDTLNAALRIADVLMNAVTEQTGIDHVHPRWGLYPAAESTVASELAEEYRHPLVPNGYALVAEVDTVHGCSRLDDDEEYALQADFQNYYRGNHGVALDDLDCEQVGKGSTSSNPVLRKILLDVDIRLFHNG